MRSKVEKEVKRDKTVYIPEVSGGVAEKMDRLR